MKKRIFVLLTVVAICINCVSTFQVSALEYYVNYDGSSDVFISNSEDVLTIDGLKYQKLSVQQENYRGLTYGDIIFIDENNNLVYDQALLEKLLYMGLVVGCISPEVTEIVSRAETVVQDSGIINDLGNKLIEDTLGSAILSNFKGLVAAATGNFSDWTKAYTGMVVDFGKNSALYLMMLAELESLMMDAANANNELLNYLESTQPQRTGLSFKEAQRFEALFRECFARIQCCTHYIDFVAEEILGGKSNAEVDGLDVLVSTIDSITEDSLSVGFEEVFGDTFVDALSAVQDLKDVLDQIEAKLEVNEQYETYYSQYYLGALGAEKEFVSKYSLSKAMNNVCTLIGRDIYNTDSIPDSDDYIASDFNATVEDGIYTIKNASSGKMMNVYAGKNADATNVVTWNYDGTTDQRFYVKHMGNGQYVVFAVCSSSASGGYSRCLDIYTGGTDILPEEGDNIDIYTRDEAWDDCQLFYIVPMGDDTVVFEACSVPGLVISAESPSANNGNIGMASYECLESQQWYLCDTGGMHGEDLYVNDYTNIGDYADDIVGVAKTQLGYMELDVATGAPLYNEDGTWYTKYGQRFKNSSGAWCAFFVMWCAEQADIPTTAIPQAQTYGKCTNMANWFKNNGLWQDAAYTPWSGDIVFFDWDDNGNPDHVGIVESVNADGSINTIEGNICLDDALEPADSGYYQVGRATRSEDIFGYGTPSFSFTDIANSVALIGGKTDGKAYMLPDSDSETVWYVDANDRCVVLCWDNDYYLLMYPFLNTGKYITAYVPADIVSVFSEPYFDPPLAEDYYTINKQVILKAEIKVYHNPSTSALMNGREDVRIRATWDKDAVVTVLFKYGNYYFVRTETQTGFVPVSSIALTNVPESNLPEDTQPDETTPTEPDQPTTQPEEDEKAEDYLMGDVDGNGKLEENDGLLILQYAADLLVFSDDESVRADADGNGTINVADAAKIFMMIKEGVGT